MTSIKRIAKKPPSPKTRPVVLAKALGMYKNKRGQGSCFTDYYSLKQNQKIAIEAFYMVQEYGGIEDYPFHFLAKKYNIGKGKIRRIYKAHLNKWQELADKWGQKPWSFSGDEDDLEELDIIRTLSKETFHELQ